MTLQIDYIDKKSAREFHLPISVFKRPHNAREYSALEKILDELIDTVRDDETHPLADVMQIIGENLEQYDNEHFSANRLDSLASQITAENIHSEINTGSSKGDEE